MTRIRDLGGPGVNRQVEGRLELGRANGGPRPDIFVHERELRRSGPPPNFIRVALGSVVAQEVMGKEPVAECQPRLADAAPHVIRFARDEVQVGLACRGCL